MGHLQGRLAHNSKFEIKACVNSFVFATDYLFYVQMFHMASRIHFLFLY